MIKPEFHSFHAALRFMLPENGPPVIVLACTKCGFFWLAQDVHMIYQIMRNQPECQGSLLPSDLPEALHKALAELRPEEPIQSYDRPGGAK